MTEEQKRILSHLKYIDGLGESDGYLVKALNLIDELNVKIQQMEEWEKHMQTLSKREDVVKIRRYEQILKELNEVIDYYIEEGEDDIRVNNVKSILNGE